MRAITICQPYAWLFTLPASDPRQKRVENRKWPTHYRGPVLIHAGKSAEYFGNERDITALEEELMPRGAIIARAWLFECFAKSKIDSNQLNATPWVWLKTHRHTEGPYCHIIGRVETLRDPIFCAGKLNYWDVPQNLLREVEKQLGAQTKWGPVRNAG